MGLMVDRRHRELTDEEIKKIADNHGTILKKEKKCSQSDFPIDSLWNDKETSTNGYETKFLEGVYDFDIYTLIKNSDIMKDIGCDCIKEQGTDNNNECKIATNLGMNGPNCGGCYDSIVPCDISHEECRYNPITRTYYKIQRECLNIEYGNCSVNIINENLLRRCLENQSIYIRHTIQPSTFELGGAGYILESYWKKVQMLTHDRRICHVKNIGIEVDINANLYDLNTDCGGNVMGSCNNNLLMNGSFENGVRIPPPGKPQWKVGVNWYPWWNNYEGTSKAPEMEVIGPQNRPGVIGFYQKVYTPKGTTKHDTGIFQVVTFGDKFGNPISISPGSKISLRGFVQSFVASPGKSNGFETNPDFKMMIGVAGGNLKNQLLNSGPSDEPYVIPDFESLMMTMSNVVTQSNTNPSPVGWSPISLEFRVNQPLDSITVFLRGKIEREWYDQINSFWDEFCLTVEDPSHPIITNIEPVEEAEFYPWSGIYGGGYCEPDKPFEKSCNVDSTINPYAHKNVKAYFPYFGSIIHAAAQLDLLQPAIGNELDIPDCEEANNDTILCYCKEDQVDQLAVYLNSLGMLNENEKILAGNNVGTGRVTNDSSNNDTEQNEPPVYVPTISQDLLSAMDIVSQEINKATGQCIPKEMLAAIMWKETTRLNYSTSDLTSKFRKSNSKWCSNMNIYCSGLDTPEDGSDQEILNVLRTILQSEDCTGNLPNDNSNCSYWRGLVPDLPQQCCDVRGPMQFEIRTWVGYQPQVTPISISALDRIFGQGNYDYTNPQTATRARLVDSIVAAGLKLRANCADWETNEEYTVRYQAGCYVGGCNPNSSYARDVLARYNSIKGNSTQSSPPDPSELETPPVMGNDYPILNNLPSNAIQLSINAQCRKCNPFNRNNLMCYICNAYPYNMKRMFARLTPSVSNILYDSNWTTTGWEDPYTDFAGYITLPQGTISTCDMFGNFTSSQGYIVTPDSRFGKRYDISGHGVCNTVSFVTKAAGDIGLTTHVVNHATYRMPLITSPYDVESKYKASIGCPSHTTYITNNSGRDLKIHWQVVGDIMSIWISDT